MNRRPTVLTSILLLVLLSTPLFAQQQEDSVIVNSNIQLPKADGKAIVSTLNGLLDAARKEKGTNEFVFASERLETQVLLDELSGIQKNKELEDEKYYKPYLTNIASLEDKQFLVQVSFIGTKEKRADLRASFEFVAHKIDSGAFRLSSPLIRNTRGWTTDTVGSHHYCYQQKLNREKAQFYGQLTSLFDKKLKLENKSTTFYCCQDAKDALRLFGVQYKADYNGDSRGTFSATIGDKTLTVLGNDNVHFDRFDPHDLWHHRLSLRIPRSKVNQPIDEGCAHLYGGSWGESWENILKVFEREIVADQEISWLECKHTPRAFGEGYPRKFYVDHVVNALLVKKIESEKGFDGVWEFLNCGPRERITEDNYFRVLKKLTGITKQTYDNDVWKLVKAEVALKPWQTERYP